MLTKVFEKLGVEALDESAKTEVSKFISEMVELKAKERAKEISEEVLVEEKAKLVEDFESKFSEYKEEVLSKWSDFVDGVIEEQVQLPQNVIDFAAIGEKYAPIMEKIRMDLAVDEGTVSAEANAIITESKKEIEKLRAQVNGLIKENMEIKEDAKAMAVHIHLRKKCDGLTEAQKKTVMDMLGDLTDVKQINDKFDFVVENFLLIEKKKKEKEEKDDDEEEDKEDCDCDKDKKEDSDSDSDKPDFLKKDKDKDEKKDKKKKKDSDKGLSESADLPSNWELQLEGYAATAKKPLF